MTLVHRPIPVAGAQRGSFPYPKFRQRGGRGKHRPGEMNGTEAKYASRLDRLQESGEVAWYAFEAITFKLAPDTRYTADFIVMLPTGDIEFHEVKGTTKDKKTGKRGPFVEPAAKIRIKVAAELFPFRFSIVYLVAGVWERKDFFESDRPASVEPAAPLFAMGGTK